MELDTIKGHEFYLRHLLLLGKAATIPLRAIVERAVGKRNETFEQIFIKSKLTLQILLSEQYSILFPGETVNVDTKSWDTRLLCKVIWLLFASDLTETESDAIACIMEQWNDLNNYAVSASLDYKTYEKKRDSLQSALFEMLTTSTTSTPSNQKANFECTRLMISFTKEPIQVNMSLIENLKENKDITEHVKVVIGHKVSSSDDDAVSESMGAVKNDVTNNTEIPVVFIENLTDKEVSEGDDITFTCKVNVSKGTPVWFHDETKVQHLGVRRSISSCGTEHTLKILNAKLGDSGNYRAVFGEKSSEATLTVKDTPIDSHKQQLTKGKYRNWVRGALSLLYLKQGLVGFSNKCMQKQYDDFLSTSGGECNCNSETLPQKGTACPTGFCRSMYNQICDAHRYQPCLKNADVTKWKSEPWSVGTCFVNTPGYKDKLSAQALDCSGLLSVFINDTFFNTELGDVGINGKSDVFKKARDARNEIPHNPNYELSESELKEYIDLFKDVLEVTNANNEKPLENELGTPQALHNLKRLQTCKIEINEEVNSSRNIIGEQEVADILKKAEAKMKEKINALEEKVKGTADILNGKSGDFKCKLHPQIRNEWYCIDHYQFCCTACREDKHRTCEGIRKVISETTERKIEESILMTRETNVRIEGIFTPDKEKCSIVGMCVLPNQEILLVDINNKRLKKLNSSLKLVSYCGLPVEPCDVCYIGNDVAAVCTLQSQCLQFVDVSGNMKLKKKVKLIFRCRGLACHRDTLYAISDVGLYTCNTDGKQQLFLFRTNDQFWFVAVSDDGEKIYLTGSHGALVTIDNEGKHLSTLRTEEVYLVRNVCTVGDGSVLIYDSNKKRVVLIDYEGKRVLGTVVPRTVKLRNILSLCFDRQHCRLIVGGRDCDQILVFQLK